MNLSLTKISDDDSRYELKLSGSTLEIKLVMENILSSANYIYQESRRLTKQRIIPHELEMNKLSKKIIEELKSFENDVSSPGEVVMTPKESITSKVGDSTIKDSVSTFRSKMKKDADNLRRIHKDIYG